MPSSNDVAGVPAVTGSAAVAENRREYCWAWQRGGCCTEEVCVWPAAMDAKTGESFFVVCAVKARDAGRALRRAMIMLFTRIVILMLDMLEGYDYLLILRYPIVSTMPCGINSIAIKIGNEVLRKIHIHRGRRLCGCLRCHRHPTDQTPMTHSLMEGNNI